MTEAAEQTGNFTFVSKSRDALCPECRSAVEKRMRNGLDIYQCTSAFCNASGSWNNVYPRFKAQPVEIVDKAIGVEPRIEHLEAALRDIATRPMPTISELRAVALNALKMTAFDGSGDAT